MEQLSGDNYVYIKIEKISIYNTFKKVFVKEKQVFVKTKPHPPHLSYGWMLLHTGGDETDLILWVRISSTTSTSQFLIPPVHLIFLIKVLDERRSFSYNI